METPHFFRALAGLVATAILAAGIATAPAQAALLPAPCGTAIRDYTCDGHPDLLVKDSHDILWLYPNDGDGGFKPRVKSATGWHYTMIIPNHEASYNGVYARDGAGTLWSIPGNGHGGWLKRTRVGGGWNQMTSIIDETSRGDLLAIDRSGTLWRYPFVASIGHTTRWLPRQRVSGGWAGTMLIDLAIVGDGPIFHARDTHGTIWPYWDDKAGIHRTNFPYGTGFGKYTQIVQDGDFENVDGYINIVATDTHGTLWFFPASTSATGHRVMIGHGFNSYTIW